MPTFEDLRIWKEAHSLMREIHVLCKGFPVDERFRLRDQAERSSASVCDNIAEGYTAYYYNEKIKGMYIARKEAGETQNHLRSMQAKNYIVKSIADDKCCRYQKIIKGINGYIKYVAEKRGIDKKGYRLPRRLSNHLMPQSPYPRAPISQCPNHPSLIPQLPNVHRQTGEV